MNRRTFVRSAVVLLGLLLAAFDFRAEPSAPTLTRTNAAPAQAPSADLSLTDLALPDPAFVGIPLVYILFVTNNGPNPATKVMLTDVLPAGVTFFSASPSAGTCSGTSTVTCNLGDLPVSGNALVTIVIQPTTAGTLTNTASVAATEADPNPTNNSVTRTTPVTSLSTPGTNAALNGPYAFLSDGFDASGNAVVIAGSFVADGAGKLTSGVLDLNRSSGVTTNLPFTGTYTVGPDNRGSMTLTSSQGTMTLRFALSSFAAGVASKARFIEFDDKGTRGSGIIEKQDPTVFSAAAVNGDFAFGTSFASSRGVRSGAAGRFTAAGGNISNGLVDVDDARRGSSSLTFSGTYTIVATGRGDLTVNIATAKTPIHAAFYVVSAEELLVISTEPQDTSSLFSGQMLKQVGPFSSASLNGTDVISLTGLGSVAGSRVQVGLLTASGTGSANVLLDENDGGTITANKTFAITYTVAPNGRVTITSGDLKSPVLYMVNQNQAFIIGTDNSVTTGFLEPQATGPFSNASLFGIFAFGSVTPATGDVTMSSGLIALDGAGRVGGIQDSNFKLDRPISDTYTVSANGRITISGSSLITYMVSPAKAVGIDARPGRTRNAVIVAEAMFSASSADLSVTKTALPDPVLVGANLTYSLAVTNLGPATATGVTLKDVLPASVAFVSATPSQGSCSGTATVTCNLGILANTATANVTIVVRPMLVGTVSNTASVAANEKDPDADNNTASTTTRITGTPMADLSVTKSGSPNPVNATATLTYTLTVSNAGPSMASSLRVTDTLPAGVKFVSATGTDWLCNQAPPGTVICTRAILTVGAAPPITITVTAPSEGGSITNTASVTANEPDPNTTNNTASVSTTVFQFSQGLVFAAVGSGHVKVFKPDGTLVQTLDTGLGGGTAGMIFDNSGNLYVADFSFSNASKFDHNGIPLGTFGSGYNAHPESIVQSLSGHFFVGQADVTHQVLEFDAAGNLVGTFSPAVENRGTDWIQLLPDQKALLYTSEGHSIKNFDLSANKQNPDFTTGLPGNAAYAFRIVPDGTVLVADTDAVLRLSTSGTVIQTYSVPGVGVNLFALNLDPNGTDFLTADLVTGIIYRMNIATGALVNSFDAGLEVDNELGGLAIFGEKVGAPAVTLSPASLDFGSQPVGTTSLPQTVTLTNSGTAALAITSIVASGDYTQTNTCGSSLAAGGSCVITVAFTPTAASSRSGAITITDNAPGSPHVVSLTGAGILAPVITLSSTSLIFGSRLIGTTSPSQTSTLTNSGTAVLNIATITASGDFAQTNNCGTSVPVGANCTISANFTPSAAGFRTGGVAITSDARGSVPVITLTGIGFAPGISLSSTILIFADQSVGTTSAPQTVTLNNGSGANLTITSIVPSGDFAQTNTCGSSVASGSGCTISVTFTPTARGARTGAITITDIGSGSPRTITLTGTGAAPVVTLIPPSLSFTGNQTVGTTSLPLLVTLTNSGNATLTITGIAASLNFFQSGSCGNSVAAGASCTISVTFTPTMPGLLTGTVTITDNAADSPQMVNLTGNAVHTGPAVMLSPLSLTFATPQPLGTVSASQTVTLTNSGNDTLTITSIVSTGDFIPATGTTCANGGSVAAGASCTINVSFAPTAIGTRAGAITVTDNAGGSPHVINLTGTGAPSGPAVSLSTANLSFGSQPINTTSPTQVVTLTNGGTAMLTITSVEPSGDFAPAAGTTCKNGGSVTAGASCTISVTFSPTATGTRNGAITIADNAPGAPHTIALSGTGTDFSITTPPGSTNTATISAGQAATYTMTLAPSGGFNETITISCSGVPPGGACSISPSLFTLNTTTKITTTVTTTAHANAGPVSGPQGVLPLVAPRLGLPWLLVLLAVATLVSLAMFERKHASLAFGMTTLFALLCLGCAGGAGAPAPVGPTAGTPPGNYTLTVTASTSNGFSHSSTLNLTVK